MTKVRRICLVGAGTIARAHAEALRMVPGVQVTSVVDPDLAAARRLAGQWSIPGVFSSVEGAIAAGGIDAAQVLVPPDAHARAAFPFLEAGLAVLVEKPLATSSAEVAAMRAAAAASGAVLGVNQNFVHHPAFVRLRRTVEQRQLGRPVSVGCVYNVALKQLAARQFGHWMFREPGNILLEQAVHPLSQVAAIAGPVEDVSARAGAPVEVSPGVRFFPAVDVLLGCARLPAQLRFAVGQDFPFWQVSVVCDDGVVVADVLANRVMVHRRTRWMPTVDGLASGAGVAASIAGAELRNASAYGLSTLRLRGRSDAFFQSMKGSIGAFYAAIDAGRAPELDGAFGGMLVAACERISDAAFAPDRTGGADAPTADGPTATAPAAVPRRPGGAPARSGPPPDVAVLGGTGFIGTQVVHSLLRRGKRVAVMARSVRNLPAVFAEDGVALHQGSIADEAAVARAIEGAPVVVNLAHGGGAGSFEQVRDAMVGGAALVGRLCAARPGTGLVHIGSIAALYLGPQPDVVTGATPPDPQAVLRANYARAKAMADLALMEAFREDGLPVVILRPGLVVGEGTSPFHSGLGFFNNDQHCIGWNQGRNPLPWVLVEDVADAVVLAAARIESLAGRCFNLVGDVRPSARGYIADLARALERPLRFHPKSPTALWLEELGKWGIKRAGGRAAPVPSRRDILSRGLSARFDCTDVKQALGWRPVADAAAFQERAILVHARR